MDMEDLQTSGSSSSLCNKWDFSRTVIEFVLCPTLEFSEETGTILYVCLLPGAGLPASDNRVPPQRL